MMSGFSYYVLLLDLLLNLLGVGLGIILIIRAQDNRLKLFWGIGAAICSLNMFIDNVQWLERYLSGVGLNERNSLFVFARMVKWYVFAHILSMFPIASLRPGWLNATRIGMFAYPLVLSTTICLCYVWFNGQFTEVYSWAEVLCNLDKMDIQVRLGYFAMSVLLPVAYFFFPFVGKSIYRHMTTVMYLYVGGVFILLLLYILFITSTTDTIFTVYGFLVTLLPNLLTLLYVVRENPLSVPNLVKPLQEEVGTSPMILQLNRKMNDFMKAQTPFIDSDYSIKRLANDLDVKIAVVSKLIEYNGFVGFNEYIDYLRVELFKELAQSLSTMSAKELLYRCGFTASSGLYRNLAGKENLSAREYVRKFLSD